MQNETIYRLDNLVPGETMVYVVGDASWSNQSRNRSLVVWSNKQHKTGNYDFTQKKIDIRSGLGVYEYRATRRKVPKPISYFGENGNG